jgi:hypothetical protein
VSYACARCIGAFCLLVNEQTGNSAASQFRREREPAGTRASNEDIDGFRGHGILLGSLAAGCSRANGRLVAADINAKANGNTIPPIDRDHCQR